MMVYKLIAFKKFDRAAFVYVVVAAVVIVAPNADATHGMPVTFLSLIVVLPHLLLRYLQIPKKREM